MNPVAILRDAWRITWKNWQLWFLNLLLLIVFLPAGLLAGGFGGMAATLTLPPLPGREFTWLRALRQLPTGVWLMVALAALVLLVATTAVSWMLQAAAMRGAAMAAERGTFTLKEALALGRQRVISLIQLSTTFGLLIALLGLLPPLAIVLLRDQFAQGMGMTTLNFTQSLLAPVNMVLGLALLLVMMSVALEDLKPKAAFRRGWQVFRSGWWGFLLVVGLTILMSLGLVLLAVPLIFILPVSALLISATADPTIGILLGLGCCGLLSPIGLGIMLFIAVFTLVMYTLTYREAARLA